MTSPRETARQIAEEHGLHPDDPLVAVIASLAADLAQARQELETERIVSASRLATRSIDVGVIEAYQAQLTAAEQARDEALKEAERHQRGAEGYRAERDAIRDVLGLMAGGTGLPLVDELRQAIQSAVSTALLEAAADMKQRHDTFLGIEIAQWLTTRAGGPRT